MGQPKLLHCDAVCGEGVPQGTMVLASLPTIKLGASGADSQVSGFVYILGPCGSLQWTLLWGWEFLPIMPQPSQVFSIRDFEALFACTGTLGCAVCLTSICSSWFICMQMWDYSVLQLPPCLRSSLPSCPSPSLLPVWMNVSSLTPKSLVVGLPYSSIFCQFWLFFCF